jgi:hypothetical protein
MKVLVVLMMVALSALAMPSQEKGQRAPAVTCDPDKCLLPSCKCSNTQIPGGLKKEETPQFVILTFDDAVNPLNIIDYRKALYNRKNPNSCPVAATFFVAHEYCDYSMVHELHANGQEIALHSISHEPMTTYWKNASLATLQQEFTDERTLISNFAKIPEEDIKGIRMPFLQMAGNNQFNMLKQGGFLYDLSWGTQNYIEPGMWPYTTEYLSTQECLIGPCPTESYSDVWVIPMINWKDNSNFVCSMVDACLDIPTDVDGLTKWMIKEFNKQYNGNRAPFGFYVHAAWFSETINPNHLPAYIAFLDYLQTLPDVFLTSASQVIDWVKKPVPVSQMTSANAECQETYPPFCQAKACQLKKGDVDRWMTSCTDNCPKSYPWLGNALGTV